jgi:hypothetical protein
MGTFRVFRFVFVPAGTGQENSSVRDEVVSEKGLEPECVFLEKGLAAAEAATFA